MLLYTSSNMAEKKKVEATGAGGGGLLWGIIALVIVLMAVGTYVEKIGIGNPDAGLGITDKILASGDSSFEKGKEIINKVSTSVRQSVGGAIIGEQSKIEVGKIIDGPVTAFGEAWYMVDYKDAPDGWVLANDITGNVTLFRSMNIFPIVFSALRPIGLILTFIFFILIALVVMKQKQVESLREKKKEVTMDSLKQKIGKNNPIPRKLEPISTSGLPGVPANLPTGDIGGLSFQSIGQEMTPTGPRNLKWERVQKFMKSHNSSDWKQAIMEADILLDEMLTKMGYEGNSIGEQLKQIEESDFITLNKAWEAHKFRNHIAHKAGDFVFSKSEADRIIGLYEKVFQEFYYI